jgi:hypothetical protein
MTTALNVIFRRKVFRTLRGCDPPEALISDAGLYPMSEKSFILRIHLMIEITRILRQRLKSQKLRWRNSASVIKILIN